MLSLGGGRSGPQIDYEARPPIVAPPANAALPAPGSGETVQNWPNDPDVVAREQKLANANQRSETGDALVDPGFRLPKQTVEVVNEESTTQDDELLALTGQQGGKADAVRQGEGRRRRAGRRQRQPGPHSVDRAAGRLPDSGSDGSRGIRGGVQARPASLPEEDQHHVAERNGRRHRRHRRPRRLDGDDAVARRGPSSARGDYLPTLRPLSLRKLPTCGFRPVVDDQRLLDPSRCEGDEFQMLRMR